MHYTPILWDCRALWMPDFGGDIPRIIFFGCKLHQLPSCACEPVRTFSFGFGRCSLPFLEGGRSFVHPCLFLGPFSFRVGANGVVQVFDAFHVPRQLGMFGSVVRLHGFEVWCGDFAHRTFVFGVSTFHGSCAIAFPFFSSASIGQCFVCFGFEFLGRVFRRLGFGHACSFRVSVGPTRT